MYLEEFYNFKYTTSSCFAFIGSYSLSNFSSAIPAHKNFTNKAPVSKQFHTYLFVRFQPNSGSPYLLGLVLQFHFTSKSDLNE
jgi:hypothetical protein